MLDKLDRTVPLSGATYFKRLEPLTPEQRKSLPGYMKQTGRHAKVKRSARVASSAVR